MPALICKNCQGKLILIDKETALYECEYCGTRQNLQNYDTNIVNSLLERGFMSLEDEAYLKADEVFEEVLNQHPKSAEAYMGKLLAYYHVKDVAGLAEKIFEKTFRKKEEVTYVPDYDIAELLQSKFICAHTLSEKVIEEIKSQLCFSYTSNLPTLESFLPSIDYVSPFCDMDNTLCDSNSQTDDRAFNRYQKYASEELKAKFNIYESLNQIIEEHKQIERERVEEITKPYSKEGFSKLIEEANARVRALSPEEFAQIDDTYRKDLEAWENAEKEKLEAYETECKERRDNWSEKRVEIQNTWKEDCERLTREYHEKKANYDIEKARVEASNAGVMRAFQKASGEFEKRTQMLEGQSNALHQQLEGLKGFFKGKKRRELTEKIEAIETEKSALVTPVIERFGEILPMPEEIGALELPQRPKDSDTPYFPQKPEPAEKPSRGISSVDEDGIEELCNVLEILNVNCAKIRQVYGRKTVTFGKGTNQKPIEWMVLKKEKGLSLLISKQIITKVPYHEVREEVTWENCSLRQYLNYVFLEKAFTREERNKIKEVSVKNKETGNYSISGGKDTKDKVFCLSLEEIEKYFVDDADRAIEPSESVSLAEVRWWLRSPGYRYQNAADIDGLGDVDNCGYFVDDLCVGVRPAMWVRIES